MGFFHRSFASHIGLSRRLHLPQPRFTDWFEDLPPFWIAYSFTLTEIVGAGILALPIAVAQIGPLAGIIVILLFGIANLITLSGIAEAITRHGSFRYGSAYFGRLTEEYLGSAATSTFGLSLMVCNVFVMIAYMIGIAKTLSAATSLPELVWAMICLATIILVLQRKSLNTMIATALTISFINIALILVLVLMALPHVSTANLLYIHPSLAQGKPWDTALLATVFGTVLGAFLGHMAIGTGAKTVLRRDPSGHSLFWGNIAAMITAMLLYTAWIFAVNGSVPAALLTGTSGTALIPLALVVGPQVHVAGIAFVVLGMGMATYHCAVSLYNQVREWLPNAGSGVQNRFMTDRIQNGLATAPVVAIGLVVLWLLWTGQGSFTDSYSFMGVITVPLLAGIFPLLLLIATRRRGDYVPASAWPGFEHPVILTVLFLVFWGSVLVHGLWIWTDPLPRFAALLTSLGILVLTWRILRRGALRPLTVIEVRTNSDGSGNARFQIVRRGTLHTTALHVDRHSSSETRHEAEGEIAAIQQVNALLFHLPSHPSTALKIWLHTVSEIGHSTGLAARIALHEAGNRRDFTMQSSHGQLYIPLSGKSCQVEIILIHNSQ